MRPLNSAASTSGSATAGTVHSSSVSGSGTLPIPPSDGEGPAPISEPAPPIDDCLRVCVDGGAAIPVHTWPFLGCPHTRQWYNPLPVDFSSSSAI
ncbi:MAG: hypothetical protein Q8P67_01945 [archaeon]|nr:hypothetical protein [archaeon]